MSEATKERKELNQPAGSLGFFRLPEKSVVHLVPPVSEDGPFSDTAICGTAAYIIRPFERFDTVDGQRVCTGIGHIMFKDVRGWLPSFPPNGATTKLCKRCRRSFNVANS